MIHANTSEGLLHPKESGALVNQTDRLHYMDNIRALAMLLGILFHASLAYSPLMHNLWFTAGDESSWLIDFVAFFTHLFRMPVFFILSGFFFLMLVEKRGVTGMLKNRALRILLPFIIFLPLVMVGYVVVMGWAMENVENLSPLMQFIQMSQSMPDAPQPPLSTTHLWFLFNLFLFILTATLLYKMKVFKAKWLQKIITTKFLIFIFPLLLVPALANQFAPHPAPEKFYPELWSFGFYGLLFFIGAVLYQRQYLLEELATYKNQILIIALLAFAYFYYTLPASISSEELMNNMINGFDFKWGHLPVAIAESYAAVGMSLYLLIIGKRLLNQHNSTIKLVADSSYWVYIVHMPILLMVQFAMTDMAINMWLKFVISSLLTFIIGFISYLILVRWTPIGWMLNGRK